jgi:acyl carrier protein
LAAGRYLPPVLSCIIPGCNGPSSAPETALGLHTAHRDVTQTREGKGLASTLERVQSIVTERLGVNADQVVPSAEFIGDLNADSLDLVEVIMAMEQEFDLEIKDEEAENIRTVGDAVKFIDEHAQS